jgi:hypothetical protein
VGEWGDYLELFLTQALKLSFVTFGMGLIECSLQIFVILSWNTSK